MARPSATPYMRRMTDRPTLLVAQPHLAAVAALLAGHYAVLSLWD